MLDNRSMWRHDDELIHIIDSIESGEFEMDNTEFVTNRQWDNCAYRIMRKNLDKYGRSLTASGIAQRANNHIIDIRSDQDGMIVKTGWRDAMREVVAE